MHKKSFKKLNLKYNENCQILKFNILLNDLNENRMIESFMWLKLYNVIE